MRKQPGSIDGFVPKNDRRQVGVPSAPYGFGQDSKKPRIGRADNPLVNASQPVPRSVTRREIDDSLKDIDDEPEKKPRRGLFGRRKEKKPKSRRRKIFKRIIVALVVILLLIGAYVGIHAFIAGTSIFKGNIFDFFQNKPLKMDSGGRTNILVLGNTDDDPNHPGNNLTDTIMIISLDQNKKNAYMFSIPRDLWVDYGRACDAGYQGKINVYFSCVSSGKSEADEQERLSQTQKFVGNLLGIDIQYGVHVNSVVVRDAVDAVGGVDVDIQGSNGDPGVLDRNFDGQCNYTCYWVKYTNGVHHLDAAHAMYLSMARGSHAPTYGLSRGNFDREINQQKIVEAIKKKATSIGVLANPIRVTKLIDGVGNNLKTNFSTSEIQTLVGLAKDIPDSSIKRLSFIDNGNELVTIGNVNGQSIVQPSAGLYDYSAIRAYLHKNLYANAITREDAHVALFNGSGVDGYAKSQAARLEALGFDITTMDTAPKSSDVAVTVYDLTGKKPATKAKLESTYGVKAVQGQAPFPVSSDTDFVVVYGAGASAN